ncbi:hypothetical protein HYH03_001209 [Edaphochlamys debaryana]|uniref:Small ribosomal subunit protein uS3 C-terminal domain-containing protein n=1 Tax=Edaphochlamys debaryana TaxID=47281 RepID=A0A835YI74_9CHLO|nr:hypothetical protein HYH03_001209 [Edaphochlamys debaryana]|eukprot:KAG2501426.1 hypothetical protein HYH03_001209 [Edaphochlamys debaryana]
MSGKGKGKPAAKQPAAPPPTPVAASAAPAANEALLSAGARKKRQGPPLDTLSLLTPAQRTLAEALHARPAPDGDAAAAATPAADAAAAAAEAVPLKGVGQLGLPLGPAEVAALIDQSLSGTVGQQVHFQPLIFENILQSAPVAASYVAAALESGNMWSRIERFFVAALEGDRGRTVRGFRLEVSGRLGSRAEMSETFVSAWGDPPTRAPFNEHVDYGMAQANTRLGAMGVKVWIRYAQGAVKELFYPHTGGSHHRTAPAAAKRPSLSLEQLYAAAAARAPAQRLQLPYDVRHVAWWLKPGYEQPPENRLDEMFLPDYDPSSSRLTAYLRRRREEARTFRSAGDRRSYLETTGRFMAKQKRLAAAAATGGGKLGRWPDRALAPVRRETVQRWRKPVAAAATAAAAGAEQAGKGAGAGGKGGKGGKDRAAGKGQAAEGAGSRGKGKQTAAGDKV